MINPYEWEENYLLVSAIVNGTGVVGNMLLDHVTQEDYFEFLMEQTNRVPYNITVVPLTEESFEILYSLFKKTGQVLGEK